MELLESVNGRSLNPEISSIGVTIGTKTVELRKVPLRF